MFKAKALDRQQTAETTTESPVISNENLGVLAKISTLRSSPALTRILLLIGVLGALSACDNGTSKGQHRRAANPAQPKIDNSLPDWLEEDKRRKGKEVRCPVTPFNVEALMSELLGKLQTYTDEESQRLYAAAKAELDRFITHEKPQLMSKYGQHYKCRDLDPDHPLSISYRDVRDRLGDLYEIESRQEPTRRRIPFNPPPSHYVPTEPQNNSIPRSEDDLDEAKIPASEAA